MTRYFWFGTSIVKSEDLRDRANELQKEAYIKMLLLLVVLVFCLVQIVKQLEEIWNPHHAAMHKSLKKQTFL